MRDDKIIDRRVVMWRNLLTPGLERCEYQALADGTHMLDGSVLIYQDGVPIEAGYTISMDADWEFFWGEAVIDRGDGDVAMYGFQVDETGTWFIDFEESGDLEMPQMDFPPIDLDLGFTPATNMLPIRRLKLAVGETREVTAVWVRFPDVVVMTLAQWYTRLAEDRYLYRSPGFEAEITVDDIGMPIDYAGLWERVR